MRAHSWRALGAILGLAALSLAIFFSPTLGGLAIGAVLALTCFALGERAFRRLATKEEIRADLEDRVRNPPG
ncbi:MAG: hypothetical protein JNK46_01310 [Methylobacteriaceae bacterium]|nr:hypothetical protein [Methylobacteriaceae bacterium]